MTPLLFCKHRSILQRLLMLKAACGGKIVEHTVSGAIVTFITNLVAPLKQLVAQINSVQDLNGYSYPWPAGGGVNLLDPAKCSVVGPGGAYGLTVTHDQATAIWTISGTPTLQNASLSFNFCTYSDFSLSGKGYQVQAFPISGTPIKNFYGFRNEAENKIAIIIDTVANPTVNMTFKVSVAATAQTAWSPYSNICPITGYDNVTLKQSNRNIWAFDASYSPSGYAVLVPRNTEFYLPAGTYTFSAIPDIESSSIVLGGYYADDTQVTLARLNASEERQSATFTIARPLHKMYLIANKGGTISDIQLEVGDTATDYEPYTGDTYSITFPSEAGTVYGGTLDVTTGKLTVTHGNIASYSGETMPGRWISSMDVYSAGGTPTTGAQVVYELATTQTYQLTPTEVATLLGDNTIWASTGDVSVTYYAKE